MQSNSYWILPKGGRTDYMKEKKGDWDAHDSTGKHYMRPKGMRSGIFLFLFLLLLFCSVGCGKRENKNQFNGFTTVSIDDVPADLASAIQQRYESPFELTYSADKSDLYIVKGYGRQESSGYHILIDGFYYCDDGLVFDTDLLEPEMYDPFSATPTYPYIIIKTGYTDDNVIFE